MKINGSNTASSGSIPVFAVASNFYFCLENALSESLDMLMITGFTLQGKW